MISKEDYVRVTKVFLNSPDFPHIYTLSHTTACMRDCSAARAADDSSYRVFMRLLVRKGCCPAALTQIKEPFITFNMTLSLHTNRN